MHTFFGIPVDQHSLLGTTLPLFLAVVLGGVIGLEREISGHPAGMRTHILVCVGSTLMTLVSTTIAGVNGSPGDPARLAAQIVSGIGFLCAGAILREGNSVRGLTTAASVWTTAGIGIALGADAYYGQLAVMTTIIVLLTLWLLNHLEDWINVKFRRELPVTVTVVDSDQATATVLAQLATHSLRIEAVRFNGGAEKGTRDMHVRICPTAEFDQQAFLSDVASCQGVKSVDIR